MSFSDTIRGLWRRWYIVLPGLFLAASLTVGTWSAILPGYERSSTLLLIPGAASIPDGANPYLFLGGLTPAADVIVRAAGAENVLNELVAEHPGVEIEVSRDTTTAGPVILIVVTAASDAAAKEVQGLLLQRTETVLQDLQDTEGIAVANRVSVLPITVDKESILQQRSRFIASGAAGLMGIALTMFVASLVDGFGFQRTRGSTLAVHAPADSAEEVADLPNADSDASTESSPASTRSRPPQPSGPTRRSRRASSKALVPSRHDGAMDKAASPLRSSR